MAPGENLAVAAPGSRGLRRWLPSRWRQSLRRGLDAWFCRSGIGIEKIGGESPWHVVRSRLAPGTRVLSGGAGQDVSFEVELVEKNGCRVAVFDPSPTGAATMARCAPHPDLHFFPMGLAATDSTEHFAPPVDPAEGSFGLDRRAGGATVEFVCVGPALALELAGGPDVELVKIDIEGFEYEFLAALLAAGIRPAQLAVEFHHFLPHISWRRTAGIVWSLYKAGYRIVYKNQCDYLFVRRSLLP